MKIAYLSTFYPYRGGIAQFNAALYRHFEQSHEVRAYTFTRQYPQILFPGKSQMVGEGDPADRIPAERVIDTVNPISYLRAASCIARFAPDLLVTKFWMPFFAPSLGKVARSLGKRGTKRIAILDNVVPHEKRPGDMALIRYFLRSYDGFVTMSSQVENDLLSVAPEAKFIRHPHPLYEHFGAKLGKSAARSSLGIPQDSKALLFYGFIRSYKGLDLALDALSALPEEYYLVIAGEPYGDFIKYEQQIDRLGLRARVRVDARYISDAETPAYFSACDACLLPYKTATQSGITAIAFHFDLPIIATDTGGLRESVEPFGAGVIAPRPEPEAIRAATEEFFREGNPAQFAENIRRFKKDFSWDSLARSMAEFAETL